MKFTIPIVEKISNNKLRTVHWGIRNKITKEYKETVAKAIGQLKAVEMFRRAVELEFIFYFYNRPLDCSNCAGMVKMIEDGLVEVGTIPDDKFDLVTSIKIMSRKDKENPRIEIELK